MAAEQADKASVTAPAVTARTGACDGCHAHGHGRHDWCCGAAGARAARRCAGVSSQLAGRPQQWGE